jgi:hypothetical protein
LSEKLCFRKLCSRWVLKTLTDEHKMKRQASALTFQTWYSEQGDDFLSCTVTGDETWMSHVIPESKQQSMEWRHTSLPIKKKFKETWKTLVQCNVASWNCMWRWKFEKHTFVTLILLQ